MRRGKSRTNGKKWRCTGCGCNAKFGKVKVRIAPKTGKRWHIGEEGEACGEVTDISRG